MAHKRRYRSTPLGSGCVPVTRILGLHQTNTFTFNRYAVKPGRQCGPHSEKPKPGEMVVKKKVSGEQAAGLRKNNCALRGGGGQPDAPFTRSSSTSELGSRLSFVFSAFEPSSAWELFFGRERSISRFWKSCQAPVLTIFRVSPCIGGENKLRKVGGVARVKLI
jgi:hypothetical protein